jgi:hypothetical protein
LSETIRIDPLNKPGEGTEVNVEDVLGVSRTSLEQRGLCKQRADRSADRVLTRDVEYADTTLPPDFGSTLS